jgi:hypothetical protein
MGKSVARRHRLKVRRAKRKALRDATQAKVKARWAASAKARVRDGTELA